MQRNAFRLERVLNFRREAEKLRKLELAAARREYELAEDRLRREEEAMEKLNLEFMERQIEGICALELQLYSEFFRKKKQEITLRREQVNELDRAVLEKRENLMEASTDKKIMEELKKKKVREQEKLMAEKERNFLDELALRPRRQEL